MWCFPAVSEDRELVWLRATRSQHVSVTRITHQAAIWLGLAEAYQVRLRLSGEPRFVLRAEGVETLECVRSRSERRGARVLQPDVIIGWPDWNKVQPFVMNGWAIPGQAQVAFEDESERWPPNIPQRGAGPDEKAVHHHP